MKKIAIIIAAIIMITGCKNKIVVTLQKENVVINGTNYNIIVDNENTEKVTIKYKEELNSNTGYNIVIFSQGNGIGIIANENAIKMFRNELATMNNISKMVASDEKIKDINKALMECRDRVISTLKTSM